MESRALIKKDDYWPITRPITDTEISAIIHGAIAERIDRLSSESKKMLQEASLTGRSFYYEILKRVTEFKESVDKCLSGLKHLDLNIAKSF